jgi:hypothetical protein
MAALALIAVAVVVVLTVAALRTLTRRPDVGPESSDAAKEYAEMKERQGLIAFGAAFCPRPTRGTRTSLAGGLRKGLLPVIQ